MIFPIVALVQFVKHRSRNKRVGTRNYKFPRKPGGWFGLPAVFLAAAVLAGCAERAVIVPPTVPVRLAEQLYNVSVWVKDTTGREVKARADLFPGMIIATDPQDFPTATRARFMNLRRDQE
jgi:hypothetical protein